LDSWRTASQPLIPYAKLMGNSTHWRSRVHAALGSIHTVRPAGWHSAPAEALIIVGGPWPSLGTGLCQGMRDGHGIVGGGGLRVSRAASKSTCRRAHLGRILSLPRCCQVVRNFQVWSASGCCHDSKALDPSRWRLDPASFRPGNRHRAKAACPHLDLEESFESLY